MNPAALPANEIIRNIVFPLPPPPPVRTRYVCRAQHTVAGIGVRWGQRVAWDWSPGGSCQRDARGEHDGVALETARDVETDRLRGCWGGITFLQ